MEYPARYDQEKLLAIYRAKGLPTKKTYNFSCGVDRKVRPWLWAGETPTPQDWIIYFLEIPKLLLEEAIALLG
jgi:hypothetical protein